MIDLEIEKIKLSVIMCIYNERTDWVIDAIESVLNQTFREFEFIIIIDSPQNYKMIDVITQYMSIDSRIVQIVNKENIGLANSLNKGIKRSKGELIARIDADDVCMKNRFEIQIKYLEERPDVDLLGTNILFIDEDSHELSRKQNVITAPRLIKKFIPYRNVFHHPTWMFRKQILEKIDGYRPFPFSQDYDFICRCFTKGIVCRNLNDSLVKYRIRSNSISVAKKYQQSLIVDYIQSLYKIQNRKGCDDFSKSFVDAILIEAAKSEKSYVESERLYELSKEYMRQYKFFSSGLYFSLAYSQLPKYRLQRLKNAVAINVIKKLHKL